MNQHGFATFYYLLVMKLFLITGTIVMLSYSLIRTFSQTQNDCRKQSLEAQSILAKAINDLEFLNPKAFSLRSEEDIIRVALQLPQLPPVYIALQTKLRINQAQQYILRTKQQSIISMAEFRANKKFLSLRTSTRQIFFFPTKLNVNKLPPHRIAQTITPVEHFVRAQTVQVRWQETREIKVASSMGSILNNLDSKNFNFADSAKLNGTCKTTLEKRGSLWQARLKKAM